MGLTACRRPGGGEVLASRAHWWSSRASLGSGSSWWGFSSGRLEVALCTWCRLPSEYRPSPSLPARQVDIWFEWRLTLSSLGLVARCQPEPSVQSAYPGRSERAAPSSQHTWRTQVRWSARLVQPSIFRIGLFSMSSPRQAFLLQRLFFSCWWLLTVPLVCAKVWAHGCASSPLSFTRASLAGGVSRLCPLQYSWSVVVSGG